MRIHSGTEVRSVRVEAAALKVLCLIWAFNAATNKTDRLPMTELSPKILAVLQR
jgi:hypothetical protein